MIFLNKKNIIEKAIRKALKRLNKTDDLDMDFDRDTKGNSRAVIIADTILQKLSNCSIFIADISFVRNDFFVCNLVNQNVLFELGYAVKRLGYERVILLFNMDKGKIENLPFDIRQLRILSFTSKKQKELEDNIHKSLKIIYEKCDFRTIYDNWEQHDIDALQRMLYDISEKFGEKLDRVLLSNRRYESSALDYIHDLEEKVVSNENYLINTELRELAEILRTNFSSLGYKIASRFAPDKKDNKYQVLDKPSPLDTAYQEQYYNYLTTELPQAINAAVETYNNLCHKRTELFGI